MLNFKKIIAIFLCILILLSSSIYVFSIELEKNYNINLNIVIKDEQNKKFNLNKNIILNSEFSIMNILDNMADKQYIKTYEIRDNNIYSITPINSSKITNQGNNIWTYYINGAEFNKDVKKTILNDGDNIEIVYKNINYQYIPENSIKPFDLSKIRPSLTWDKSFNDILSNSINYLKLNSNNQNYISAVALSGNFMDIVEFNRLIAVSNKKEYDKPVDISNTVLALTFSGVDAQNVRGNNLLEKIYNFKDYKIQGPIGVAYMLLALDSDNYQIPISAINTRKKLIDYLLSSQKNDGGFSNNQNISGLILDTAMVLTALSKYKYDDKINESIRNGLNFLSKKDYNNCIDLSGLIIALKALDISIDDSRFTKSNINLLDQLISYIDGDGGFKNNIKGKSEVNSTELAIIALISFKNNHNPYLFKDRVQSGYMSESENTKQTDIQDIKLDIAYNLITIGVLIILTLFFIILRKKHNKELQNEK